MRKKLKRTGRAVKTEGQTQETIERFRNFRYALIFEGMGVGVFAGIVIVLFRLSIEKMEEIVAWLIFCAQSRVIMIPIWFFALFFLVLAVASLLRWEPLISGSGIPQVKGEMKGLIDTRWYKVLAMKFVGGVLSIGGGLSLGREGPSIQLGAMAGKGFSRLTKKMRTEEKLLMTCGAGAGLAAAFNAPFAGVVFSLEELHKNFSEEVLLSTMAAAITSDFVSRYVFGLEPVFKFDVDTMLPLKYYGLVVLLGLLLGFMGVFYNLCIKKAQDIYSRIPLLWLRLFIPFALVGVLGLCYPQVLGGGHKLVEMAGNGQMIFSALCFLFIIKYIFSMLSFGSGAPGGIFLPLLVMGAVLGAVFCDVSEMYLGIRSGFVQNFVILGMAGYFAAIVRAPITGIILISEMTGSFSHLLTLSIVSLSAYVVADFLRAQPIYDQLLSRLMEKGQMEGVSEKNKVLVESPVYYQSPADGKQVKDMHFPSGSLVVSIVRGQQELVPDGMTTVRGGDKLIVLCNEKDVHKVDRLLGNLCRRMDI